MEFKLQSDFIELDNLLKTLNIAASGGAAKSFIQSRSVFVNGSVESRIRRKLRAGDMVVVSGQEIKVVA